MHRPEDNMKLQANVAYEMVGSGGILHDSGGSGGTLLDGRGTDEPQYEVVLPIQPRQTPAPPDYDGALPAASVPSEYVSPVSSKTVFSPEYDEVLQAEVEYDVVKPAKSE